MDKLDRVTSRKILRSMAVMGGLYTGHSPLMILRRELFPQPLWPLIRRCIPDPCAQAGDKD